MTFQIPDTLVLCGTALNVESPGISPSSHPLVHDRSKSKPEGPRPPSLKKSSALHRGYMATWEIREDGRLILTSASGRYEMLVSLLHAEWVSTVVPIQVGEVDETLTQKARFEIVREACLELRITKGNVTKWRLVERGKEKGVRWIKGFDWPGITAALEERGIGADFQPPRQKPDVMLTTEDLAKSAEESAALLRRARAGEDGTGKVLAEGAWKVLSKGWADPFPDLDVHAAVRSLRGHGSPS